MRLRDAALSVWKAEKCRITLRYLYYRLVSMGLIDKTQNEYKNLCALATRWRRAGEVPWDMFVDNTRWRLGTETYQDINDALLNCANTYRKNLWQKSKVHAEMWVEKDAIASILSAEADRFGVKVFPCRGFASLSSLYEASVLFKKVIAQGKDVHIYYFGDHDPSGLTIDESVTRILRDDFDVEVSFVRMAVTQDQIRDLSLPTRPTKPSDKRRKAYADKCVDGSVEVDAISPQVLRSLVRKCITQHLDEREWRKLQETEKLERNSVVNALLKFPKDVDPYDTLRSMNDAMQEFGLE